MASQLRTFPDPGPRLSDNNLSPKSHWDDLYHHVVVPRTLSMACYNYFRFDQFFKKALPRGPKRLLEVGCGASAWLVYFAKEYGYRVSGIDYSESGCELARENLRLNQVQGRVDCRDLFSLRQCDMGDFDLVFSYGVVEHFEQPAEVLRLLGALLSPGGLMIVIVPNLGGIYGFLQRRWNESVYRMHQNISPARLAQSMAGGGGITVLKAEHFGTFYLSVVNWSMPAGETAGVSRRVIRRVVHRVDRRVTSALRMLRIQTESRLFSPYVIAIGTKTATEV